MRIKPTLLGFHLRFCVVLTATFFLLFGGCNRDAGLSEGGSSAGNAVDFTVATVRRPDANLVETDPVGARIFRTNVSEDLILKLTPKFKIFKNKIESPGADWSELFLDSVSNVGLEEFDPSSAVSSATTDVNHPAIHLSWPLSLVETPVSAGEIWAPLLQGGFKFEELSMGVVSGEVLASEDVFEMKTIFEGRFRDAENRLFGIKAKQTLGWFPASNDDWKIGNWKQDSFELTYAPKGLFENVTAKVIPNEETLEKVSRSKHEEVLIERFEKATLMRDANPKYKYFSDWESSFQYPAVSVVDIDGDQWDDLFVVDRWGESALLRNNGDQTFEDISDSSGLKIDAFGNCAMFVDFDNDGDSDVMIGRNVEGSLFFRNDNGKFVPDEEINEILSEIKFVVSGSVVDVNGDGLLDVYLGTYCFTSGQLEEWVPLVVREEDELKFRMGVQKKHPYVDRGGPPNVLLMNRGGKFERVKIDNTLKQWRNSYQTVWNDIDNDGDPDLYVCNDFSPDVFLRNDTEKGSFEPKFSDVTEEVFPGGTMGFGMGAQYGDYDADGQLDLYVSNMYSKAGLRVLEKMGDDVDPRIKVSAQGNFLYKNQGGKFKQVAGLAEDDQHVSKVGWSFGGQMADFNNDAKLDLYVPSGFFTAPKVLQSDRDL
jgi:hypothetical protein